MRKWIAAAAVLVAAGAAAAAAVGFGGTDRGTANAGDLPPASARVTRQTLVDSETASGELGYGEQTTLTARRAGTVTWLAAAGTTIKRGAPVYRVDNEPVVLLYGSLPAYREMRAGVRGSDVKQFERNLSALGYDGFTADDEYTSATAEAVRDWQDDLGVAQTGRVDPGRIVYAPSTVRVDARIAAPGDLVQPGKGIATITGTARVVTVLLDVADQRLAKNGAAVRLAAPNGERIGGKITKVSTVIQSAGSGSGSGGGTGSGAAGGSEPETKIEVTVAVDKPAALAGFDQASVDVDFTASERKDVLTVPVAALLALSEGGYGVEIVSGGSTRVVAVRTGLFADGRVEISGTGIAEGMTVGMPS